MTRNLRRFLAGLAPVLFLTALPASAVAADQQGRIDHVEAADGGVRVLFSVPEIDASVTPDPASISVKVNGQAVDATATPVAGSDEAVRRTTVLAIDVSRSMRGRAFEAAKQAALTYIKDAPRDVYIGLVTFASEVETVQRPTQDRTALTDAVNGLGLTLKTRLYDGVLRALDDTGGDGQRSVLLLSDGKDNDSTTDLATVVDAAATTGVRVDVVALNQSIGESSALRQIASASGGTVIRTRSLDDLRAFFAAEADDLAKQLLVTFDQPSDLPSTDVNLTVSVDAGKATYSDEALVSLTADTSNAGASPVYESTTSGPRLSTTWLLAGAGMLFLGFAALLGYGMTRMGRAELSPMQRQLQLYTVSGMARNDPEPSSDTGGLKDSALAVAEMIVQKRDFEQALAHKLDRAGLSVRASEWLLIHVGLAIASGIVGLVISGGNILVTLFLLALGLVLPWAFLSFKESRRIKAFNGQLAQTLQILAGALQAGLSLPQAVDTVVQEGAEPVAGEFKRAIIEQRLGVEVEDALDGVADRMGSTDFKWVVMAVRIQREVGGNLAELLLNVAATLREREYLRRQVSVLSAEGRLSAWILGGLPPLFVIYLTLARPEYIAPLYHEQLGWVMLGVAAVMMVVGVFWMKQAVKVEV